MREHNYATTTAPHPDDVVTKIPHGLTHRLLDIASLSAKFSSQKMSRHLHRAHHFNLGVEASQALVSMTREPDWLREHAEFAPHPFPDYTVSFFIGDGNRIIECLVMAVELDTDDYGIDTAAYVLFLEWGSDDVAYPERWGPTNRLTSFRSDCIEHKLPKEHYLAWFALDAFRLIMAAPGSRVINHGPPGRTALRRGKRVHFYSKSEITIRLDRPLKDMIVEHTGHGKMMPVYQYRAHLCHSGGIKGCDHEFERDYERTNPYWVCSKCGRRRWHRKAGTRGSAEIGYVRQTYRVLKGEDK